MNPTNPSVHELRHIEQLFLRQMRAITLNRPGLLNSFDIQCSDRWC